MSEARRLLEQATPLPWTDHFCHGTAGGDECWQSDPHHDIFHPDAKGDGSYGTGAADIMCVDEQCPEVNLVVYAVNHLPDYEAALDVLERLVAFDSDPGEFEALNDARAVLRRLREGVAA